MASVTDLNRYRKIRNQRRVRVELSILTFVAPYDKFLAAMALWFLLWGPLGYSLTGLPWGPAGFGDGWWGTWHRWSFFPLRRFDLFLFIWFLPVLISGTIGVRACRVAAKALRATRLFNSPFTEEQLEKMWPGVSFWVLRKTKMGFWVVPMHVLDQQEGGLPFMPVGSPQGFWFRLGSEDRLAEALHNAGYTVYVIDADGKGVQVWEYEEDDI